MQNILISKLHVYLRDHQPELLMSLEQELGVTRYLIEKVSSVKELWQQLRVEGRPDYVIEALCMEDLTRDFRPSRFEFMKSVLEEEFASFYYRMQSCAILTYEVINLVGICEPIFEIYGVAGLREDSRMLRYAVSGMISEYVGETSQILNNG